MLICNKKNLNCNHAVCTTQAVDLLKENNIWKIIEVLHVDNKIVERAFYCMIREIYDTFILTNRTKLDTNCGVD